MAYINGNELFFGMVSSFRSNGVPDIYNHGDVVGLNGEALNVNTDILNIYYLFKPIIEASNNMTFNSTSLTIHQNANQVWYLPYLINTRGYKYICFEVEASGKSGAYNVSDFGVLKKADTYTAPNYFKSFTPTNYNHGIYNFSRQTVKLDISDLDDIYIAAHACHCTLNIYSIYLSNEE